LRRQVVYLVCGYVLSMCVCVCVSDLLVCGRFDFEFHNQTSHRQVHQALTRMDNIQPHTKQTTWRRKQAQK